MFRLARYFSALIIIASVMALSIQPAVSAVDASSWRAGNIIDDPTYTDKSSMSIGDIQAFLDSKVSSCDIWGQKNSPYWAPDYNNDGRTSRAEYGQYRNNPTPFTCLKDYREVPKTSPGGGVPANNYGNVNGTNPSGSKSAAEIIWQAAQDFNISPKTLLVTLQKESGLITDDWTFKSQLVYAMGAHCPDTGPGGSANCDPNYGGFSLQIRESADLMRYYLDNMQQSWWSNKRPYQNNYIQYDVETSCGGSNIYMENKATTALYVYTPYQPSQAALNAGYGSAEPCGAYGNRNFWLYFNDWFGSAYVKFQPLDSPRWMRIKQDTQKRQVWTDSMFGDILSAGRQIKFVDKIYVNNQWYLRTEYDSRNYSSYGIPQSMVEDIVVEPFQKPRYLQLKSERKKWNPTTGYVDNSQTYTSGRSIKFVDKITVNGASYYRSAYDSERGAMLFITASSLQELSYVNFETPRYMQIRHKVEQVDPTTDIGTGQFIEDSEQIKFDSKILINDRWFYRTTDDTSANLSRAIPAEATEAIPYTTYSTPSKWLLANIDAHRYHPASSTQLNENVVKAGSQVLIAERVVIDGVVYLRTDYDKQQDIDRAIPASSFSEIPFVPLENPRTMSLKEDVYKKVPKTGQNIDGILERGMSLRYTTKISVNGVWYLRTEHDSQNNLEKGIPLSYLE